MPSNQLPLRQVHLDFHTSPHVPDVGHEFDAETFANAFAAARVNSVTVFAKCHHGHLYYETDSPARHPTLPKGSDMLRQQVDALHARGIRAPIYISVQCDEYAADTHPEWVAIDPEGRRVGRPAGAGTLVPGWQILDMSSPYQEYLAEQTREVLTKFHPVDGIFFDMCWDQVSCSTWAKAKMLERGFDPGKDDDRHRYAHANALAYMERFYKLVKEHQPTAGVYFNSRRLWNIAEEIKFQAQVEIEALPTGGWGYAYFPRHVRMARTFGKPYLGMTARFHKSWADFGGLKPRAALEYESAQMLAHGAGCSIGDQMHPRGTLDPAAYDLIGHAYQRVEAREPWCEGTTPLVDIGVVMTHARTAGKVTAGVDEGVVRMLTQLRHQFNVIDPDADFSRYKLLVLPDETIVDDATAEKLRAYLKYGGAVLGSYFSGVSADGQSSNLLHEYGIVPTGLSPFTTTYLHAGKRVEDGIAPTEHVMYERHVRVAPAPGALSLAVVVEPYFERSWKHFCSHRQTPNDKPTKFSAAVLNEAARCAYVAYPIFGMFARHGSLVYRQLVGNIIKLLLPEPRLTAGGPSGLETSVMRQPQHADRTIVHLLFAIPERRAHNLDIVEDVVPLFDVPVSVKLERKPTRAYLAPEKEAIEFVWSNGRADVRVPQVRTHAMVVFEFE